MTPWHTAPAGNLSNQSLPLCLGYSPLLMVGSSLSLCRGRRTSIYLRHLFLHANFGLGPDLGDIAFPLLPSLSVRACAFLFVCGWLVLDDGRLF